MELGTFRQHYQDLLTDVAAKRDAVDSRLVAAHWPHVGTAHRGLLLVGQALKGWERDWEPDRLLTGTERHAILEEASAVHSELEEPMSWVPTNARVGRSSFWLFARRLADAANPGPEPWYARFAWWNLYPLAPTDPEGNPYGSLRSAQDRMAPVLLNDVVDALDAKQIAFVPGRLRLRTSEPVGLKDLGEAGWPVFASGRVDGRSWVVGEHPGWASRRGYGVNRYGPLVARILSVVDRTTSD